MELAITTYNMNMDKSKDKTPIKDFGEKVSDISLGNEQTHEGLIISQRP